MRNTIFVLLAAVVLGVAGCSNSERSPHASQTVGINAASIDPGGIESVAIAPGLSSRTLRQGDGDIAQPGHTVIVHYTGWLFDPDAVNYRGTKFDSSVDRGTHFKFRLGAGSVIRGWDQGVTGMQTGEVRELTIGPELAYGQRGASGVIPPGATLIFVVELAGLKGYAAGS